MSRGLFRRLFWVGLTLLSHYRRHPAQTLFLVVGLVTGVGLWSAVQIINSHARASYAEADQVLGAQASHWVRSVDGAGVTPADYVALRRMGFTSLYPVIEARVLTAEGEPLWLIATDLLTLPHGGGSVGVGGESWLEMVQPPYQSWYPPELARSLGIQTGDALALNDGRTLPPAVVQSQEQQGQRVFMDVGAAMAVLGRTHFSYLAAAGLTVDEQQALEMALPESLRLEANRQRLDLTQLTESLHTNLTAMSLLSFAVGLFIVFNAVRYALLSRSGTFHTLRELGVNGVELSLAILMETLVWSLVGTALGLVLGLGLAMALLPALASTLQNLYGAVIASDLLLQPRTWGLAWAITLAGLLMALAWPLWQESRQTVRAGRDLSQRWWRDRLARRRLAWVGAMLAVASLLLFQQMASVVQGFMVLGLALFAAAFVLPLVLSGSLALVRRWLPPSAWRLRWAVGDGEAQLPTLRIAMMALLLALTANLGVEMLIGSFRTALTGWLDQRLAADLYVQRDRLTVESLSLTPAPTWLAAHHQRMGLTVRWQGHPTELRGMDPTAPDSQALPLATASASLDKWYQTGGEGRWVIANEQVQHLGDVSLGDSVELETDDGVKPFEIVGFVHDYGNPYFQFYMPTEVLLRHWASRAEPQGLALWLSDETNALDRAEQALLRAGARPGDWLSQGHIKEVSLRIFDRTFAIPAAMNGLTLGVAALALLTALLAIHQQRLPDYAHWRALGLSFRDITGVVGLPLGLIVLLTWLAAIPLGALLSWLLIHHLNVLAFGWTMPLQWQWAPAVRLGLLTALITVLTLGLGLWQVRRGLPSALRRLGEEQ